MFLFAAMRSMWSAWQMDGIWETAEKKTTAVSQHCILGQQGGNEMIKPHKIKSDHIPLAFILAGFLLIQIFNPFDVNVMISAGTWIIVLSCVAVFLRQIAPKRRITTDILVLYTLILINLLSMLIRRRFSYASIVSVGCFLEIPIIMCAYTEAQEVLTKRTIYYIFCLLYTSPSPRD